MKGFIEVKTVSTSECSFPDGEGGYYEIVLININDIQMVQLNYIFLNSIIGEEQDYVECYESYEEIKKLIEEAVK